MPQSESNLLEKRKDYKNLVITQAVFVLCVMVLQELLTLTNFYYAHTIAETAALVVGGLYLFLMNDMLANYSVSRGIDRYVKGTLILVYGMSIIFANPFVTPVKGDALRLALFIVHTGLYSIEIILLYFSIKDIFSDTRDYENRLWGSAAIYLMIAISFGSLFDLVNIAFPGSLGVMFGYGLSGYMRCEHFSFAVLAGLDSPYPDAHELVKNIAIIESIIGNLYVVIVVGRLLAK